MASQKKYIFSSESVTEGHPDKVADQISDVILDSILEKDPQAKVACETLVTSNRVIVAGETFSRSAEKSAVDEIVRAKVKEIGYDRDSEDFNHSNLKIENHIHEQSSDIRQGVELADDVGAGDQGMMFGYACDETPELMPLPIKTSHNLVQALSRMRKDATVKGLRPDGKAQVSVLYEGNVAKKIETVLISTQHEESVNLEDLGQQIKTKLIESVLPQNFIDDSTKFLFNPTGRFVVGGPHGDVGLTGRKIIVDTYGGSAPHGGGAFSGKDATKVDRSAAYAARFVAKNVVAAGLAKKFQVQLAYAIGVPEPVSVYIEDFGTALVDVQKLEKLICEIFPLKPSDIIKSLKLTRPIFKKTSAYGHFGRNEDDFTWESSSKVEELKSAF